MGYDFPTREAFAAALAAAGHSERMTAAILVRRYGMRWSMADKLAVEAVADDTRRRTQSMMGNAA